MGQRIFPRGRQNRGENLIMSLSESKVSTWNGGEMDWVKEGKRKWKSGAHFALVITHLHPVMAYQLEVGKRKTGS